jgi:hypothetical protein
MHYEAPTVGDRFVLVKLEASFPAATRKSEKARDAIIADMVAAGVDRETANKMAHSYVDMFPDGELKAIKTPFYSFNTYLDRISIRWLGGKGAPKLVSVHMIDKIEARFAEAQLVMLPLIDAFKANYSKLLDSLEARTSGYFDRSEYPTVEELNRKFRFEVNFSPIGDPRQFDMGVVSEQHRERMAKAMQETAKAVTREYADSVRSALQQLSTQLLGGKVDGKFVRFSENNVSNLLDLIEADLNAAGNPELAEALADAKRAAALAETAAIHKNDKAIRTSAADAASKAANKLAGLF